MPVQEFAHRSLRQCSYELVRRLAVSKQLYSRDAADAELGCDLGVLVDVDLDETEGPVRIRTRTAEARVVPEPRRRPNPTS